MLVLAVDVMEKLRHVPLKNLGFLALGILGLIVAIILIKKAAGMNRIIFVIIAGTICVVILMTWVYERNEPAFLTPMIDKMAPFFPSAPQPLSARPDKSDPGGPKKPAAQPAPAGQPAPPKAPAANPPPAKAPPPAAAGKPTTTRSKVY
jgi:hypothetical protein